MKANQHRFVKDAEQRSLVKQNILSLEIQFYQSLIETMILESAVCPLIDDNGLIQDASTLLKREELRRQNIEAGIERLKARIGLEGSVIDDAKREEIVAHRLQQKENEAINFDIQLDIIEAQPLLPDAVREETMTKFRNRRDNAEAAAVILGKQFDEIQSKLHSVPAKRLLPEGLEHP